VKTRENFSSNRASRYLSALFLGGATITTVALSTSSAGAVKTMTREAIETLAKPIVKYSYWWGHGQWRMDGKQPGHCSGSCGACTHWGGLGADCSGFIGKAWQIPSPISVSSPHHPYNTTSFHGSELHWKHIVKKTAKAMDAMVRDSGGSGHIIMFKKGNPYGSSYVYECAGCSIGCVYNLRGVDASYVGVRRNNVIDFKDADKDGVADERDNCKNVPNKKQTDLDKDGKGDECDPDIDGDKVPNAKDNCPYVKNPKQEKSDKDGKGNACDKDDDNDGVPDVDAKGKTKDNCRTVPNKDQKDTDKDGKGDACDDDDDNDGTKDAGDNCDTKPNKDQKDTDKDGIGDACDNDDDNDGVNDKTDNCPKVANPLQEDLDDDTIGDVCDDSDDRLNPLGVGLESVRSSATPNDPTGTSFEVCVGADFTYGFTLKNTGTGSWFTNGDGQTFGSKVSLQTGSGAADPFTGSATASLPGNVAAGATVDLNFTAHAPNVPGQFISEWRLIDQKGGPFGQTFQVTVLVSTCAPPEEQPPLLPPTPVDPPPEEPSGQPDPADPTDPANPADPSDPSDPSDPTPDEPYDPSYPSDPVDPNDPSGAGNASGSAGSTSAGKGGSKSSSRSAPVVEDQGGCQVSAVGVSATGSSGGPLPGLLLLAAATCLPLARRRKARR
jgi:hypothetical protein